ncbi:hypothetical protein ACVWIQ_13625, partial [Enterococcus faecium]
AFNDLANLLTRNTVATVIEEAGQSGMSPNVSNEKYFISFPNLVNKLNMVVLFSGKTAVLMCGNNLTIY